MLKMRELLTGGRRGCNCCNCCRGYVFCVSGYRVFLCVFSVFSVVKRVSGYFFNAKCAGNPLRAQRLSNDVAFNAFKNVAVKIVTCQPTTHFFQSCPEASGVNS